MFSDFRDNLTSGATTAVEETARVAKVMYTAPVSVGIALVNGGLPAAGREFEKSALIPLVQTLRATAPVHALLPPPYNAIASLTLLAANLRDQQIAQGRSEGEKIELQRQIDDVEKKIVALKTSKGAIIGAQSAQQPPQVDKKIPWGAIATGAGVVATVLLIS